MSGPSDGLNSLLPPSPPSRGGGTARARIRKKGSEPEPGSEEFWGRWLERHGYPRHSNEEWDIWRCVECGAPIIYAKPVGRHAGPAVRSVDRRYGWHPCRRIENLPTLRRDWPHDYGAWSVYRHDSAPSLTVPQPTQDPRLQRLPSSFVDSSRTYGTIPGVRKGVQPTARDRQIARPDGVRLVAPTDGRLVGWLRAARADEVLGLDSGPSTESLATDRPSSTESLTA